MSGPESTKSLQYHLRRMADVAVDRIDADRLSRAADELDCVRYPAVLAAMPEVRALVAGAFEAAAKLAWPGERGSQVDPTEFAAGCRHNGLRLNAAIRAMTPADAIAARDAMIAAAETRALDSVTTLHTVIADIRAATVGSKPMLSELAAALVAWRDEAVRAERKACVAECKHRASTREGIGDFHLMREAERCAAAIRKRGKG